MASLLILFLVFEFPMTVSYSHQRGADNQPLVIRKLYKHMKAKAVTTIYLIEYCPEKYLMH